MRDKNTRKIIQYYYEIPEMVRLLREERREQEAVYDTLRSACGGGTPGGGMPGKPVENAAVRADTAGAWERIQEIDVKLRVLEADAAAVRGCMDGLSGKYKRILQMRHQYHYSWAKISVRMGTPDSTVRSWHDRAVNCLREALEEVPMVDELMGRASRARTY